jgi:hypothetical protein
MLLFEMLLKSWALNKANVEWCRGHLTKNVFARAAAKKKQMNEKPRFIIDADGETIGMYPPFIALQRRGRCCPMPLFVTRLQVDDERSMSEQYLRKQRYKQLVREFNDARAVLFFLFHRLGIGVGIDGIYYKRCRKFPKQRAIEALASDVRLLKADLESIVAWHFN